MAFLSLNACIVAQETAPKKDLNTFDERLSYALGQITGQQLTSIDAEIDLSAFVQGLEDTLKNSAPLLTEEQAAEVIIELSRRVEWENIRRREALAEENLKASEVFLTANRENERIITTESGLQYEVLREGEGPRPGPTDEVSLHYRIFFIDGQEFDSSYRRDLPATYRLNQIIDGLVEGLQLMKVGSEYRLFIHPNLAHGIAGANNDLIGPNVALIYEVELLGISE